MSVRDFYLLADRWSKEEQRKDSRNALLCYVMAMANGVKRNDGGALTIMDFMPSDKAEQKEQTPEEMLAVMMGMVEKNGG